MEMKWKSNGNEMEMRHLIFGGVGWLKGVGDWGILNKKRVFFRCPINNRTANYIRLGK